MVSDASVETKNISPYQDYFHFVFESADLFSSFWQPVLKGLGRQQLELANLGARQGQSTLQYFRNVAMSPSPAGFVAASTHYWQSLADDYASSSKKLASVATETAQRAVAPELLTLPIRRTRDMIILAPALTGLEVERKVA